MPMARSASSDDEEDDEGAALIKGANDSAHQGLPDCAPVPPAQQLPGGSGRCGGCDDPAVRGLIVVTLCFTLLFAGWVPMENLLSTYEGELGYYSLMTVYIAVVPGSFVAPWIMHRYVFK